MKLPDFKLERYFAEFEFNTPHLLCSSDCQTFTVAELLQIEEGARERFLNLPLGYTESPGALALRTAIAEIYETISPEQVLVHPGAEEAIFIFMSAVLEPGDHLIVQYPAYQSLVSVAAGMGCRVTKWTARPENNWAPDLTELAGLLESTTKAVVVNSPHNPTGFLFSKSQFDELAQMATEHNFILFSDEVYRWLEYDESERLPAMCDLNERAISLGVMSKSLGLPGLRIGWIATRNQEIYRKMAHFKDYTTICNSAPSEFLAELGLRHREHLLARNQGLIHRNLGVLDDFFSKHADVFDWQRPKAGPIGFPAFRDVEDAEHLCRKIAREHGVLLLPGTIYDDAYPNRFRMGFGRENFPRALDVFEQALSSL